MDEIIAHTSQIPHCYEFIFFSLFYQYVQVHVGNSLLPPRTWIFLSEPLALWDNSQVREWPSAILQSVCRIFTVNALSDKMQVLGGSLGNRGRPLRTTCYSFLSLYSHRGECSGTGLLSSSVNTVTSSSVIPYWLLACQVICLASWGGFPFFNSHL